MSDLIIVHL